MIQEETRSAFITRYYSSISSLCVGAQKGASKRDNSLYEFLVRCAHELLDGLSAI
jgi:hypothetical protein